MLKTVWLTEQPNKEKGRAMLLGGFDGLHVGHRKLLSCAKDSGLSVGVMTIVGGKDKSNLFTFAEREEIFKAAGVDFVFELPFAEIKDLAPTEFLQLLEEEFSPKLFVCGTDFRFGARAAGTAEMLKQSTQVCVEVIPLVEMDGEKVSSSYVKALLDAGDVIKVNALLTHPFFLVGQVYADRKVGRTIGFPTANILYPTDKYPLKIGVYESRVCVDGKTYKGITNYGARPTFADETVVTETYLDGFDGNLYGKTLKIEFIRYLRDVQKFNGVDALKTQLEEDLRRVREDD